MSAKDFNSNNYHKHIISAIAKILNLSLYLERPFSYNKDDIRWRLTGDAVYIEVDLKKAVNSRGKARAEQLIYNTPFIDYADASSCSNHVILRIPNTLNSVLEWRETLRALVLRQCKVQIENAMQTIDEFLLPHLCDSEAAAMRLTVIDGFKAGKSRA